jgi:hypothetical protein
MTRFYTLHPHPNGTVLTGQIGNEWLFVAAQHHSPRALMLLFNLDGSFETMELFQPQGALLDTLRAKHPRLHVGPIQVQGFTLYDFQIGIEDLPQELQEYQANPANFPGEYANHLADWQANDHFVLWWIQPIWCSPQGYL